MAIATSGLSPSTCSVIWNAGASLGPVVGTPQGGTSPCARSVEHVFGVFGNYEPTRHVAMASRPEAAHLPES
jgi:hypothetical protein